MNPTPSPKYIIPNLDNACRVLTLLSGGDSGLTLGRIREALSLPHTTALRIVRTLEAQAFVVAEGKSYRLGPALLGIAARHHAALDIRALAVPVLRDLSEASAETAHFCVPSGYRVLILEVCESRNPIRAASRPGTLVDAHCSATGKLFVSHRFADELDALVEACPLTARTPRTITSRRALRSEIARIRAQGYAVDDEEYYSGVRCLAAPVFDRDRQIVGAIGITASTARFTRERIPEISRMVIERAQQLTAVQGGSERHLDLFPI